MELRRVLSWVLGFVTYIYNIYIYFILQILYLHSVPLFHLFHLIHMSYFNFPDFASNGLTSGPDCSEICFDTHGHCLDLGATFENRHVTR